MERCDELALHVVHCPLAVRHNAHLNVLASEKCVEYLFRKRRAQRAAVRVYQVSYVAMAFAGRVANLDAVRELTDCFNGLMAIPNLIAPSIVIRRLVMDFFADPACRHSRGTGYDEMLVFRDKWGMLALPTIWHFLL